MIQNEKIFADYRIFFSTKQNHYILACTISEIAGHEMFPPVRLKIKQQ